MGFWDKEKPPRFARRLNRLRGGSDPGGLADDVFGLLRHRIGADVGHRYGDRVVNGRAVVEVKGIGEGAAIRGEVPGGGDVIVDEARVAKVDHRPEAEADVDVVEDEEVGADRAH